MKADPGRARGERECVASKTGALETVAVVGASLAGLRAIETLRREGFDGRLVLVGAEPHLPYDRPPLSKQLLAGEVEPDEVALRRASYDELEVELRLGTRAVHLDLATRTVELDDGGKRRVRRSRARDRQRTTHPPRHARTSTACSCSARSTTRSPSAHGSMSSPRVVVVGAGFIGSEVAATCRLRGLDVTVLEALPAPLVRGLGPVLGMVCGELHRDHGVDLRLGVGVAGFDGTARVERVRLDDGSAIDADVVVVGVGVGPVTDWLEGSGLQIDNGVVCDETLLAAPGVVAAGDVTRWPNPLFDGELMRLEHWTNAAEQGVAAARRLLYGDGAAPEPFAPVPFVWSDQYDRKIQTVGPLPRRRRDGGRPRLARRAAVRGGVRTRRPARRRARVLDAGEAHAVPEDDRGAGVVHRRARARPRRRVTMA